MLQTTLTKAITDGLVGAFAQMKAEDLAGAAPGMDGQRHAEAVAQAVAQTLAPMLAQGNGVEGAERAPEAGVARREAAALQATADLLRRFERDLRLAVQAKSWNTPFARDVESIQKRMWESIRTLERKVEERTAEAAGAPQAT